MFYSFMTSRSCRGVMEFFFLISLFLVFISDDRPKLGPQGSKFQDFIIRMEEGFPGFVNLLGVESPGLTSSLAIAEMVDDLVKR